MSRTTTTVEFQALELKGGLLPGSLLEEVSKLERPKDLQLQAADYGLPRGERLRDRIDAAWVHTKVLWEEFRNLEEYADTSAAGLRFGLRMLQEVLNWSDVQPTRGWQHNESYYPITHRAFAGAVPLILKGIPAEELDKGSKQFGQDDRKRSPHSCLQTCLNADDSANWGVLISGNRLRLLHDNPSLVKPAYLAADLELLIEGERFDEFSVLWLLLHASRFQHPQTGSCVLDQWKQKAEESGERVLGKLRGGVQTALEALGNGFLNHPDNGALRDALFQSRLSTEQFHGQLLRLIYRFLFLFTVEDRDLLFSRAVEPSDPRRQIYRTGYSLHRLRELAIKRSAYEGSYDDLWQLQRLVFYQLSISNSPLGLPGLGGLFSMEQCASLQDCKLQNGSLLQAIRAIGWFDDDGTFTRVRYRDLNTEELGSVYESLLELHPQIEQEGTGWSLSYGGGASNARKTTGSYYTPDVLVQQLVKSALVPVIEDRLGKATTISEKEVALLAIKVIDPACGSGHFLLAAARWLAVTLAQIRAGDDQSSEDDRQHALRDVVAHCIYAVDKNPMAVELCKVALWIEAIDPGNPLSFLDAHIQCGDSLVGVFDSKMLEEGIPDEAYKPLIGDEKTVCSSLKKENAIYRKTNCGGGGLQGSLHLSVVQDYSRSQQLHVIEAMPETSLAEAANKQTAYARWQAESDHNPEALAADLFTAAFFLAKTNETRFTVPTTEHLLQLLKGQEIPRLIKQAVMQTAETFRFFHWHLRFSDVMEQGGFHCVLGNPPWEEVTVEEPAFWVRYFPGLRGLPQGKQEAEKVRLRQARPDLVAVYEAEVQDMERLRKALVSNLGDSYPGMGTGKPDLYKVFCWRFWNLTAADGGRIGIVLPRSALTTKGSTEFRRVMFSQSAQIDIVVLKNRKKWIFNNVTPQYAVGLICLVRGAPIKNSISLRGPYTSKKAFDKGIGALAAGFCPEDVLTWNDTASLPLLPESDSVSVFTQIRKAPRLDLKEQGTRNKEQGTRNKEQVWCARPDREMDATQQKAFMTFFDRPYGNGVRGLTVNSMQRSRKI